MLLVRNLSLKSSCTSPASCFLKPAMSSQQLIDSISYKLNLLANADEAAIKHAENEYVKKNAQLEEEIAALKTKLINLELIAGRKLGSFPYHGLFFRYPILRTCCNRISCPNREGTRP